MFNFGLKLTTDRDRIKDTLQELFTEFWKKRHKRAKVEHVKVYLIKSFRYKLLRTLSKAGKSRTYSFEELFEDLPDLDFLEKEASLERQKQLKEKLQQLSERQREVIHLRYFQNLKNEEIAEILNVNYQSVANLLYRALKQLKGKFSKPLSKSVHKN